MIYEIVILAMIAAFLGMRLYSVLGRRAEHEEEIIPANRFEAPEDKQPVPGMPQTQADPGPGQRIAPGFPPAVELGLREISTADRSFALLNFLEGARSAYEVILESFWNGDRDELRVLCDDDVYASFVAVIDEREAAGVTLENRLIRFEDCTVHSARLDGSIARIAVRFVSDIASVTRDSNGTVIAGSLDDAVVSRDVWTFRRDIRSADPQWLLDETDSD